MEEELLTPDIPTMFRFPDEETALAALEAANLITIDEYGDKKPIVSSHQHALSVIGIITRGGEWDLETEEVITPPEVLDGWHLNYRGPVPSGWEAYAVWPQNPVRVWL